MLSPSPVSKTLTDVCEMFDVIMTPMWTLQFLFLNNVITSVASNSKSCVFLSLAGRTFAILGCIRPRCSSWLVWPLWHGPVGVTTPSQGLQLLSFRTFGPCQAVNSWLLLDVWQGSRVNSISRPAEQAIVSLFRIVCLSVPRTSAWLAESWIADLRLSHIVLYVHPLSW